MQQITIEGNNFSNLEGFYDELSSKLTKDYDWPYGRTLKAAATILKGGQGMHDYEEIIEIIWQNADKSRTHLGYKETVKYLKKQLKSCHFSEKKAFESDYEKAKKSTGKTVFDMIKEIFESADNVELKLS